MMFSKFNLTTLLIFIIVTSIGPKSGSVNSDIPCEYWVAPAPIGDDENPGTSDMPWATFDYAGDHVEDNNCTVWFKPGVYEGGSRLNQRFETRTVFKSIVPYQAVLEHKGAVVYISGGKNITLEGFNIRHSGPGASALVVAVDRSKLGWAENIILRNNIIHDSYNDDLLKIYDGCKNILVENNLFFNQGDSEEHMDVNSVMDVTIQDNIFFNSFESSGRPNKNLSKQYIVIKDSNGWADGLIGSRRINVRRNVFLNWQGQEKETIIQVGLDGKPYFEAQNVHIENNLIIGNSGHQVGAAFGVRGARDVYFINNTIVGDLPALSYAFRITLSEDNPRNENIYIVNNIWSDSTGTMGADLQGGDNEFSDGNIQDTDDLYLRKNLYWNGGSEIPDGDLISPLVVDHWRVVQNPGLESNYENIVLPFWNGEEFISGGASIREEFVRLVNLYGRISQFSPVVDVADPLFAPEDDILANLRSRPADIGAFEYLEPNNLSMKKMKDTQFDPYEK
jgi:polygalacturonase